MDSLKKLSNQLPFVAELANLKKDVDSNRPFPKDLEAKVFQKLRLDWNYNSNAIEGNSFTRGETVTLLMEGVTAKGKPLKDALDIKGHNQAIDFVMSLIKEERNLTESDVRALHKLVLGADFFNVAETSEGQPTRKIIRAGQYKTLPNHVKTQTGEIHYYATPEETPAKMQELMTWYTEAVKTESVSPVVLAALFHHKFVEIHPFDDGNGRMTRLLTNFTLLKNGYPVSVIKQENRSTYYAVLSQADNGAVIPLIEFISETVKSSFEVMLKAIHGEDISEEDDLDKEIELFRKEIGVKNGKNISRNDVNTSVLVYNIIKTISLKLSKFNDVFNQNSESLGWNNPSTSVSLNTKNFDSYEDFSVYREKLKHTAKVNYKYFFSDFVYGDNLSLEIHISITFKRLNYIIVNEKTKQKIEKLYSDEINDKLYSEFIVKIIRQTIKVLKDAQ